MLRDFAEPLAPPCAPDGNYVCLSPALRALLNACVFLSTTDTKALAKYLNRSPATINTQFKVINQCFGTSSRADALLNALNLRLIHLQVLPHISAESESKQNGEEGLLDTQN